MKSKLKPCVAAGLIALAAVVVLALYVGDSWIAPKLPAIIGAALILPVSVLGALFIYPEANQGKGRIGVQLLTILSAAIFGLGIPILWAQPQVRSYAVEQAPEMVVNLTSALDDPVLEVSKKACHRILLDLSRTEALVDSLRTRHPLAVACLNTAAEGANRNAVATKLRIQWYRPLVTEKQDEEADLCVNAKMLAELPVDVSLKQGDLFDCALRAPEGDTRQCCAMTLTALTPSCEDLAGQIDTKKLVDNNTVSALGALSYGESTAESEFREVASFVDLQCPEMQAFALKLACLTYAKTDGETDTNRFLNWKFDQHQGCLSPEDKKEAAEVHQICTTLLDATEEKTTVSDKMICDSHRVAIEQDRRTRENIKGLSSAQGAALATQIAAGNRSEAHRRGDVNQWLETFQQKTGAPDLDAYSEADKRALMKKFMLSGPNPDQMRANPVEEYDSIQEEFNAKLAANPKLKAKLEKEIEAAEGAPSEEEMKEITEAGRKKIEAVQQHLK